MIYNATAKNFMSRSDKPNENWTNDNNYIVIDDNSEFAKIIIENDGEVELAFNENGQLISIAPINDKITQDDITDMILDLQEQIILLELGE